MISLMKFSDFRDYEATTFASMREHLKPGDLVYDVGAYEGLTSGFIAEIVGAPNVVMIEPAEANWGNIKSYWEQNGLEMPRATFAGFMQDVDNRMTDPEQTVHIGKWPKESGNAVLHREMLQFRWLHYKNVDEGTFKRPALTIDTMAKLLGPPAGVLMDVEGAEFLALKGGEQTFRAYYPFVWVSVHPQFMRERFGHDAESLRLFMNALGYTGTLLCADQEEHWCYQKSN